MIEIYMADENYNLREETTFRDALFKRMDSQDKVLGDIKEQTTKTNGRVTLLESLTNDYKEIKAKVENVSGFKMWLTGAVAVILFAGGSMGFFFSYYWRNETKNTVKEALDAQKADIIKEAADEAKKGVSNLLEEYDTIKINH